MNVDVPCPSCGTQFTVRRELLGKRTKCIKCGHVFVITETPAAKSAVIVEAPPSGGQVAFPEIKATPPIPPPAQPIAIDTAPIRQAPQRAADVIGVTAKHSQPRFTALRIVARAYEIMAVLTFAIGVVLIIVLLITLIQRPGEVLAALITIGLPIFWTMASAIMFLFFGQSIRLGLQVEENTRETQRACRELADHLGGIEREH